MKNVFWCIEDILWGLRCRYNFWLHGPYGLAKVVEGMPFRYIVKYLRKYGAKIGKNCTIERGIKIHRPFGKNPFENLIIGDGVYLGHGVLVDLTKKIKFSDYSLIGARCQFWTHHGFYKFGTNESGPYIENTADLFVGKNVIVYSNVVVGEGVRIGGQSRVSANSLLINSIPEGEFWGGNPAKNLRQ